MINLLFNSIGSKLDELFPDYFIYFNKIEQNFLTPAFFVKCVKVEEVKLISDRYKINAYFEIDHFPGDEVDFLEENNQILQKILDNFEVILFQGKLLRSRDLCFTSDGNVLNISFSYSFYIKKFEENFEKMKNLFY